MKIIENLNRLANEELSYNNLNLLLKFPHDFEETPLISRLGREEDIVEDLGLKNLNPYLLNVANFFLNTIKLYADIKNIESQLFMITYPDVEDGFQTFSFHVPNLCIFKSSYLTNFINNEMLEESENFMWLFDSLKILGLEDTYCIRFKKTLEFGEYSTRIYLIPRTYLSS